MPAPNLAIEYYDLPSDARLSDLIRCVRADEQHHVANARFADVQKRAHLKIVRDKPRHQADTVRDATSIR